MCLWILSISWNNVEICSYDMFWWTLCEVKFSWLVEKKEHDAIEQEMICMCDNMDTKHR
jgi:hypothetical protein